MPPPPISDPAGDQSELLPFSVLLHSIAAVGLVVATALVADMLNRAVAMPSISILFVPAVLAAAIFGGFIPSLVGAVSVVLVCSYFFYEPIYSLRVADPQELADVIIFGGIALVSSQLTDMARRSAASARHRQRMLQHLLGFSRLVGETVDPAMTPQTVVQGLNQASGAATALYLMREGRPIRVASTGDFGMHDPDAAATEVWAAPEKPTRHGHVLRSGGAISAIVVFAPAATMQVDGLTMNAMLEQAGSALVRMQLALNLEEARIAAKAEDLREAVLSSISHDLHTPLASILGSVTTLESFGPRCDEAVRRDLQATIREAAERLERYIRKLLDLTRIRSGRLQPHPEPVDVADIVDVALRQTAVALAGRPVSTTGLFDLPMVQADPVLIEQALINILENAGKYSPPGKPIAIVGRIDGGRLVLSVRDEGIGLDTSELDRIFAPYYRAGPLAGQIAGSGLGLMVSKAFVEATGCEIWAESAGPGQGATFCIGLPLASVLQVADEGEAA